MRDVFAPDLLIVALRRTWILSSMKCVRAPRMSRVQVDIHVGPGNQGGAVMKRSPMRREWIKTGTAPICKSIGLRNKSVYHALPQQTRTKALYRIVFEMPIFMRVTLSGLDAFGDLVDAVGELIYRLGDFFFVILIGLCAL